MLLDYKCGFCSLREERLVADRDSIVKCGVCMAEMSKEHIIVDTSYSSNFKLEGGGWFDDEGGY
jgi:hypothetical protein